MSKLSDYTVTVSLYDGTTWTHRQRASTAFHALSQVQKAGLPGGWQRLEVTNVGVAGLPLLQLTRPLDAWVRTNNSEVVR